MVNQMIYSSIKLEIKVFYLHFDIDYQMDIQANNKNKEMLCLDWFTVTSPFRSSQCFMIQGIFCFA